jgi:hypothetical protein
MNSTENSSTDADPSTLETEALMADPTERAPLTGSRAPLTGPRTRWAAIVWGLVFAALAAACIALVSVPGRFADLMVWIGALDVGTAVGYGLLAIGGLVLVIGVIGLLRRAQMKITSRRGNTET